MGTADLAHQRPVGDVAHDQFGVDHGRTVAQLERVEHHHPAAGGEQLAHRVRADVAGAAGDEPRHRAGPRVIVGTRSCALIGGTLPLGR
jgi:hypothetical protein